MEASLANMRFDPYARDKQSKPGRHPPRPNAENVKDYIRNPRGSLRIS